MSKQGIDVSRWQGDINWAKVAQAKDFAIVRCTSGKSNALDSKFPANLKGCLAQNLPMGVYRYGYATTVAQAKAEAEAVVDAIRGYEMPCGVWYDAEWEGQRDLKQSTLTAIIKAFHEVVEAAGYWVGIYCNQDWYDNVLDVGKFDCPFWVARYGTNDGKMHTKPDVDHELYGWQYTNKGKVSGISGNVDLDVIYGSIGSGTASQPSTGGSTVQVDDTKTDYAQSFDKGYADAYTTKGDLYLRTGAGTAKKAIVVMPKGTQVRCYVYYTKQSDGTVWLYGVATVDGVKYTGFCSKGYLK